MPNRIPFLTLVSPNVSDCLIVGGVVFAFVISGFRLRIIYGRSDGPVLPPVKEKRLAFAKNYILNFGNKDCMVAGSLGGVQPAFQVSKRAMQNRCAVFGSLKTRSCLFGVLMGFRRSRVVLGNRALIFGKNVYAETLLRMQVRMSAGAMIYAYQNQQRIHRNRGEGICGHSVDFPVLIHRNHGDPCGKAAHRLAKI